MALALASRLRALWLVCLLALTPAGPLGLLEFAHTGAATHAATIHDPSDHGISAGALDPKQPDRHCLYCQTASTLRFGRVETDTHLRAPAMAPVDWPERRRDALRSRLRHALAARAPPTLS
jgi:hypothetical protein